MFIKTGLTDIPWYERDVDSSRKSYYYFNYIGTRRFKLIIAYTDTTIDINTHFTVYFIIIIFFFFNCQRWLCSLYSCVIIKRNLEKLIEKKNDL